MEIVVVILAAGKGIRMKSDLPKVYHKLCGKPLVVHVIETVKKAGLNIIYVIIGYKGELIKEVCDPYNVNFVEQKEQMGTGHAVMQTYNALKDFKGITLVLNGDVPLLKPETIKNLIKFHKNETSVATILTADLKDPGSYGRIIRDKRGEVQKIVEKKDANEEELKVKEINSGTYCFDSKELFDVLPKVESDNTQKEYYLTDVIGILKASHKPVYAYKTDDADEIAGINTKEELNKLEEIFKNEK